MAEFLYLETVFDSIPSHPPLPLSISIIRKPLDKLPELLSLCAGGKGEVKVQHRKGVLNQRCCHGWIENGSQLGRDG